MPTITDANVAQAIVKLVASRSLPVLEPVMVMGQLVNRDYQQTLSQQGDVVSIPIPGVMVANNIGEGGSVQTQAPDLGNAQVVLNKHMEASFTIPDVTKVLAIPTLLDVFMQPAIVAIATAIEQDLLNLYAQFTTTPVGTGAAGLGSESVIDTAERTLFTNRVPEGLQKCLVVGASAYSDLRQVGRFSEDKNVAGAGDAIRSGYVGKLKSFDVYRSQLVPTASTTTFNMAFARDAMALVTRQLPSPLPGTGAVAEFVNAHGYGLRIVMSYSPSTLAQQFTVDVLYGVAVLRNVFGLAVLS
jgi:hypothetical protein